MMKSALFIFSLAMTSALMAQDAASPHTPGVVQRGFIFEQAPFRSSHASTVEETKDGILASWFGGPYERHPEVTIWTARYDGTKWSAPVQVADGIQNSDLRYPCWNPVLFQRKDGPLLLFFKVGPSPERWWGMWMVSQDSGKTWSKPERLPDGILGPVRNKPIPWKDGLLCGSSTEHAGWTIHMEFTPDFGKTWERTSPLNPTNSMRLIQPTILKYPSGKVQILNRSNQQKIVELWMEGDDWKKWSEPKTIDLPNPNSAVDGVVLKDGRALLVYNHASIGRMKMNVAVSKDGKAWEAAAQLENSAGEYSYPAVIQASDGKVHITYTWKRQRIYHVVIDPAQIQTKPIVGSIWPD